MHISIELDARHLLATAVIVAASVLVAVWWVSPARSAVAGPDRVDDFAFVARADDPVDALATSSVAGQLGAPVFLTFPSSLDGQAADGLAAVDPQVVVLAGGTAALSEQVENEIAELLPDVDIRRMAGVDRTETARLVNELTGQLGVDRPVLAGATVAGDVGIDGTLTVDGTDVTAKLEALEARVDQLETLLAGATRDGDTLVLSGMNVQVVNGTGDTHTTNGLGNLIVGYNEDHTTNDCIPTNDDCQYRGDETADDRTGSHNLIVGVDHTYSSYAGLLAGLNNTTSNRFASVAGGFANVASGPRTSVTGGEFNTASSRAASVTGGASNEASGTRASVSGGQDNLASNFAASVSGGRDNTAAGGSASVSGGQFNEASNPFASVSGGLANVASGSHASVSGGANNESSGDYASVSGGLRNEASGDRASVTGGADNLASGFRASVTGGANNEASDISASVSGGIGNVASGNQTSVTGGANNVASGFRASVTGGRGNAAADWYTTVAGGRDGTIPDDGSFDASGNDYDSLIGNEPYPDD